MSRKRIFTVHVNIDDMTALIAGLDGQEEKADWIDGYMVGVHGHPSRETWPPAKRGGYDFGAMHFAEAEEFRAAQAAKSALGVAAKQAKSNPDGTHGLPAGVPAEVPNPTIQQSNNPTNKQTNKPTTRRAAFDPTEFDALIPVGWSLSVEFVTAWHGWVKHRKERRPALTESQAGAQLRKLEREPGNPIAAIGWIEHSIASGYQGVFAPKGSATQKAKPEWVVTKIAQLQREKRRFEAEGRTHSALDVQREIDSLERGAA